MRLRVRLRARKTAVADYAVREREVQSGQIIENFMLLKNSGKPHIIRTPLVPNITDTEENLDAIKALVGDSDWEKLPFNAAAGAKYKMLEKDGNFFDGL